MSQPDSTPARTRTSGGADGALRDAAAAWVEAHLDAVYRYARRRLPAPDAEDVTQQAFVALLDAARAGRAPEDAGAWLFAVVRRRVQDVWRDRRRRPPPVALPDGWEAFARTPLPEEVLQGAELRDLVQTALGFLPPAQARLLEARYREGASVAELAARAGAGVKAIEGRLRRARRAFEATLLRVGGDWMGREELA